MKEEKRGEIIHDALQFLDDDMIEDVEKLRGFEEESQDISDKENNIGYKGLRRKGDFRKGIALAASICVLIAGSWIFVNYIKPAGGMYNQGNETKQDVMENDTTENNKAGNNTAENDGEENDSVSNRLEQYSLQESSDTNNGEEQANGMMQEGAIEDLESQTHFPMAESLEESKQGITIPKMQVYLRKEEDIASDMIGFFIHEGRCYVQYEWVKSGADFVGEQVGSIRGMIDEWTSEDGYVDGAGSVVGDIYEVEGVSPDFMLCMVWDDGVVETYINNNGITLYEGSDLVDDRLHLRDNFKTVSFQTDAEYSYTQNAPIQLPKETQELFQQFLDSFAENTFVYEEGSAYYPFGGDVDNAHIYHLYFTTENGLVVRFALMGDGYVCFPWIHGVCVRIDQTIYDEVVDLLQDYVK